MIHKARRGRVRQLPRFACFALAATLSACATRMDVSTVAHAGGADAYELRGHSMQALQAEAGRLCPNGADVLRQWSQHERAEAESGFLRRWTVDLVDRPATRAQLQIVCRS